MWGSCPSWQREDLLNLPFILVTHCCLIPPGFTPTALVHSPQRGRGRGQALAVSGTQSQTSGFQTLHG